MSNEDINRAIKELSYIADEMPSMECGDWKEAIHMVIKALEQWHSCEDAISRSSIKQKLQEHHDFFVNAYGGFSNLPQNDKSRVDEITKCIAMVVNEPPVVPRPKTGHWIVTGDYDYYVECSCCHKYSVEIWNYCPHCGARMIESEVEE